ncbi:MAG: acyl-CoA dehydrogenase family protein [bacterium]|nr:acyl-CoA dehydrogenase family protein [bacterium]
MNLEPSAEQIALFDVARAFARDRLAPVARDLEEAGTIPRSLLREAGELGLGGLFVTGELGGADLSRLDGTFVFEALGAGCPSIAAYVSIHNMCAAMIDRYGSPDQRARWLPGLVAMDLVAAYCLTEPGSGSDAAALVTSAREDGESFVLNGTKSFISGAGLADLYLVMARTGDAGPRGISCIAIEAGTPGLGFGAPEEKMGWRAQPTADVIMDECRVDAGNLVGEAGAGFRQAMAGLDGGRLNLAAVSLGAAQEALDRSIAYMSGRRAFGATLDQFQALQFRLADMATELEASRSLLRQAAWKLDHGAGDATVQCAMAKRFVTDTAFRVANDALQLHGGYGYLADYGIEKTVRDLRVHQILEGTNEIMRLIISRALTGPRT